MLHLWIEPHGEEFSCNADCRSSPLCPHRGSAARPHLSALRSSRSMVCCCQTTSRIACVSAVLTHWATTNTLWTASRRHGRALAYTSRRDAKTVEPPAHRTAQNAAPTPHRMSSRNQRPTRSGQGIHRLRSQVRLQPRRTTPRHSLASNKITLQKRRPSKGRHVIRARAF